MWRFRRAWVVGVLAVAAAVVATAGEPPPVEETGPVPEPSTWVLTVIGGGLLLWMCRRRRK